MKPYLISVTGRLFMSELCNLSYPQGSICRACSKAVPISGKVRQLDQSSHIIRPGKNKKISVDPYPPLNVEALSRA